MISQNVTRSRIPRTCERTSYQRLVMKRSYIILMTAVFLSKRHRWYSIIQFLLFVKEKWNDSLYYYGCIPLDARNTLGIILSLLFIRY